MNVLVTGGAGFIGSHLVERLLEKGDTVYVLDDLSTGRAENIRHLLSHKRCFFQEGSVLNRCSVEPLVDVCQIIYHLAAAVGVRYIMEHPLRSMQTNIHGTEMILRLASSFKKKVLIASSSEVYGKNGDIPYKETGDRLMGPTSTPRWNYACAKALDEFMALAYYREKAVPVVITRLFNTCGPRQSGVYGMVLPRFVRSALAGEPLLVYGDGAQTRCFTYVGDAITAMIGLMEEAQAVGEIFNIGTTEEISISDLAERVIALTGSESRIKNISYEEAYGSGFEDMRRRVPDTSRIRQLLSWEPRVGLDELIRIVIEYERRAER